MDSSLLKTLILLSVRKEVLSERTEGPTLYRRKDQTWQAFYPFYGPPTFLLLTGPLLAWLLIRNQSFTSWPVSSQMNPFTTNLNLDIFGSLFSCLRIIFRRLISLSFISYELKWFLIVNRTVRFVPVSLWAFKNFVLRIFDTCFDIFTRV